MTRTTDVSRGGQNPAKADKNEAKPDSGQPDSSRARPYYVGDVRLSARTNADPDTDKTGGQTTGDAELGQPALRAGSPVRRVREEEIRRLSADPRFASWVAST